MKEFTVDVELFSGCIRVFEPGKSYGDEYVFSCSLHWISSEEVELKGISTTCASPKDFRRAIGKSLLGHGAKVLRWNRKGPKGNRLIRMDTSTGRLIKET